MQAVILAAGRGSRMKDLTDTVPKPLLEVLGKTLLEHKFDMLPDEITEIILVVGYKEDAIKEKFGDVYNGKRIVYIHQDTLDGTAGALWRAKNILKDRFLVMMGDDLYTKADAAHCLTLNEWVMLVKETDHVRSGNVRIEANGTVLDIEEGDHGGHAGIANTGLYALDVRLFEYPMISKKVGDAEYGLPQTILEASRSGGIPFLTAKASEWIQITAPEDLQKAAALLSRV